MNLVENVINFTTVITNTDTGASVVLGKGVSDLEVIGALCTHYQGWVLVMSISIIIALLLKGFMQKLARKNPKKWMLILEEKSDNILDIFLMFLAIVQLFLLILS